MDNRGLQVHYRNGTKTMVIQAFDGSLYCCVNDKEIYALEKVPERYPSSKNLDAEQPAQKPKKEIYPTYEPSVAALRVSKVCSKSTASP